MAANQIDSEQAFSGVAQTAAIGSSTSVSSGAAKIFREFKWGLLTLFILMTVVVCLVYDGGRGKKKTDTAQAKPPTDNDAVAGELLPSTAPDATMGLNTQSNSNPQKDLLSNPERSVSHVDESKDPWRSDPVQANPQKNASASETTDGGTARLPDLANDGGSPQTPQPKHSDKQQHSNRKESKNPAETHDAPAHVAEREASTSPANGAFKWYTVKAGDNLTRIANANLPGKGGNKAILEANKDTLPDANKLREGVKIRIPNSIGAVATTEAPAHSGGLSVAEHRQDVAHTTGKSSEHKSTPSIMTKDDYVVQTGDTLERIARKVLNDSRKWKELQEWNKDRVADASKLRVGMVLRTHPAGMAPTPAPLMSDGLQRRRNTVRAEAEPQTADSNSIQSAPLAEEVPLPVHPVAANVKIPNTPIEKSDAPRIHKETKTEAPEQSKGQEDDAILRSPSLP